MTSIDDKTRLAILGFEAKHAKESASDEFADDPLFGLWRDRDDMADVAEYVCKIRASRVDLGPLLS
jgi:hypothetical protein